MIAIILIIISLLGIVAFKQYSSALKKEFNTEITCPKDSLSLKLEAYKDQLKDATERIGMMHCYCFTYAKENKDVSDLMDVDFTNEAYKVNPKFVMGPDEDLNLCKVWFYNFVLQNGMVLGSSMVAVGINVITCLIFEKTVVIEKKHTKNDETLGQFKKITIMQFINIAVVVLVVNFDFLAGPFLGFIPIFNGDYQDFSIHWYGQVGKTLCLTLMINIFTPHGSKLAKPLLKIGMRFYDRDFSNELSKEDARGHKVANTKKLLQEELDDLYTGEQISSHFVYAQNYTYLWCVLMFSTGMPILYPFGFLFYGVLYWVYKFLLLKYYSRTNKFNE